MRLANLSLTMLVLTMAAAMSGCALILSSDNKTPRPTKKLPEKRIEKNAAASQAPGKIKKTHASKQKPVKPPQRKYNINKAVVQTGNYSRFLNNDSFVARWNILGPFVYKPADYVKSGLGAVLHHEFCPEERALDGNGKPPPGTRWQLVRFKSKTKPGEINLARLFNNKYKYGAAYAVTYLYSERPMNNLILYTGGGYLKIWINHKLVHAYNREARQGKWDQDVVRGIKLKKGYNLVVVKCIAIDGNWNFYFRLAAENDFPFKFIPQD